MASEAYKRLMKRIPLEVQQRVNFNMEVAHEVHQTLKEQGLTHADLAKRLGKYESEISKWLTGTHNFTIKTIQKIDAALETTILMTKSAKIDDYEKEINKLKERNAKLEEKCAELERENNGLSTFNNLAKIKGTLGKQLFSFNPNKEDKAKIKSNYTP